MNIPSLEASDALFLDFDGTLAPLRPDPDTVLLPAGGAALLLRLAGRLDGALVILSGRDVRDLALRVPRDLWRAGGHGGFVCPPGLPAPSTLPEAPARLRDALSGLVSGAPGTRLETKGPVLALHYREVSDLGLSLEKQINALLEDYPGYTVQSGKMVFDVRPESANKGTCLHHLMQTAPFSGRRPVMVGDDTTDEDAMRASLDAGGLAIKVGPGATGAPFRMQDPDAVWTWLKESLG
jgi:trehalose 6-phosphate phosphatase